uniref:Uncharacterized protein n=1 Tax=Plectus sambesii TaxID=2011161 RepID=A0A914XK02_9BILA
MQGCGSPALLFHVLFLSQFAVEAAAAPKPKSTEPPTVLHTTGTQNKTTLGRPTTTTSKSSKVATTKKRAPEVAAVRDEVNYLTTTSDWMGPTWYYSNWTTTDEGLSSDVAGSDETTDVPANESNGTETTDIYGWNNFTDEAVSDGTSDMAATNTATPIPTYMTTDEGLCTDVAVCNETTDMVVTDSNGTNTTESYGWNDSTDIGLTTDEAVSDGTSDMAAINTATPIPTYMTTDDAITDEATDSNGTATTEDGYGWINSTDGAVTDEATDGNGTASTGSWEEWGTRFTPPVESSTDETVTDEATDMPATDSNGTETTDSYGWNNFTDVAVTDETTDRNERETTPIPTYMTTDDAVTDDATHSNGTATTEDGWGEDNSTDGAVTDEKTDAPATDNYGTATTDDGWGEDNSTDLGSTQGTDGC